MHWNLLYTHKFLRYVIFAVEQFSGLPLITAAIQSLVENHPTLNEELSLYNLFRNGTTEESYKQQIPWIANLSRKNYNFVRRRNTDKNWRAYHNLKKAVQRLCMSFLTQ